MIINDITYWSTAAFVNNYVPSILGLIGAFLVAYKLDVNREKRDIKNNIDNLISLLYRLPTNMLGYEPIISKNYIEEIRNNFNTLIDTNKDYVLNYQLNILSYLSLLAKMKKSSIRDEVIKDITLLVTKTKIQYKNAGGLKLDLEEQINFSLKNSSIDNNKINEFCNNFLNMIKSYFSVEKEIDSLGKKLEELKRTI